MKDVQEWSVNFDIQYQNITSNKAPGLSEFEKSKFLTDAQDEVLFMVYNGALGQGFEATEAMTKYLASIVRTAEVTKVPLPADKTKLSHASIAGTREKYKSAFYELGEDVLFVTLEWATLTGIPHCDVKEGVSVVPVTQDEILRTIRDPFKGPNENRVLRLTLGNSNQFSGSLETSRYSELISRYPVSAYFIRYIAKPKPIILSLDDIGPGINGYNADNLEDPLTCELDESLHQMILTEAVRLAKAAWNN